MSSLVLYNLTPMFSILLLARSRYRRVPTLKISGSSKNAQLHTFCLHTFMCDCYPVFTYLFFMVSTCCGPHILTKLNGYYVCSNIFLYLGIIIGVVLRTILGIQCSATQTDIYPLQPQSIPPLDWHTHSLEQLTNKCGTSQIIEKSRWTTQSLIVVLFWRFNERREYLFSKANQIINAVHSLQSMAVAWTDIPHVHARLRS